MNTVIYLYDPLCGWCYGAGAALDAALASRLRERIGRGQHLMQESASAA